MSGKQQGVIWLGLIIIILKLITSDQGPVLLALLTNKPIALGKRVN